MNLLTCEWCGSPVEEGEHLLRRVLRMRDRGPSPPGNFWDWAVECPACFEARERKVPLKLSREHLPPRRASWTQKARIEGQTMYLTFGEYGDGRLGEIFIEASKQGTFNRGILDALARVASIALQCGTPVAQLVGALRGLNFPPHGPVVGSGAVQGATSIPDWIAQEVEQAYLAPPPEPVPEKVAGAYTAGSGR